MKCFVALAIGVMALAPLASAQDSRTFLPEGWIRGFLNFEFAPPHNEPDLGACTVPTSSSARCAASSCLPTRRSTAAITSRA